MTDLGFQPFYDRLAARLPGYGVGKLLISLAPGIGFLALHFGVVREKALTDWSWLLALIISTAMLTLFYATHTFRTTLGEIKSRTDEIAFSTLLQRANEVISDWRFALSGAFFGLLNCLFGLVFGLSHYGISTGRITILVGYFLAGFFCGMAAYGIYGVSIIMNKVSGPIEKSLDFTAPDRCGGTGFIGDALVVFSSVTLVVGVMISVYILSAPWSPDEVWWVLVLKGFWIAFPYLLSVTALVIPALGVHDALVEHKRRLEARLRERWPKIEPGEGTVALAIDATNREAFNEWRDMRAELHGMRTWPYDLNAHLKYLFVLVPNVLISFQTASSWMTKLTEVATGAG